MRSNDTSDASSILQASAAYDMVAITRRIAIRSVPDIAK